MKELLDKNVINDLFKKKLQIKDQTVQSYFKTEDDKYHESYLHESIVDVIAETAETEEQ